MWLVTYRDTRTGALCQELCSHAGESSQFIWRLKQCGNPENPMISRYVEIKQAEVFTQADIDRIIAQH